MIFRFSKTFKKYLIFGLKIKIIKKGVELNFLKLIRYWTKHYQTDQGTTMVGGDKISCFKNPHIKRNILLLPRGPKSLMLLYSIMNLNTISLPWYARPNKRPIKQKLGSPSPLNVHSYGH